MDTTKISLKIHYNKSRRLYRSQLGSILSGDVESPMRGTVVNSLDSHVYCVYMTAPQPPYIRLWLVTKRPTGQYTHLWWSGGEKGTGSDVTLLNSSTHLNPVSGKSTNEMPTPVIGYMQMLSFNRGVSISLSLFSDTQFQPHMIKMSTRNSEGGTGIFRKEW